MKKDSLLKALKDVYGQCVDVPEKSAYPTHLANAIRRDAGIKPG